MYGYIIFIYIYVWVYKMECFVSQMALHVFFFNTLSFKMGSEQMQKAAVSNCGSGPHPEMPSGKYVSLAFFFFKHIEVSYSGARSMVFKIDLGPQ